MIKYINSFYKPKMEICRKQKCVDMRIRTLDKENIRRLLYH